VTFGAVIAATYYQYESQNYPHNVLAGIPKPEKLDSLQWPEKQDIQMSMDMALQVLFHRWGVTYQHQDVKPACRQAEENGLQCLNGLGSLNTLREVNRPAMLRLFGDEGKEYYATLTALGSETATINIGADERKIAVQDIESQWFGDYSILWRTPPNYRGTVQIGDRGSHIRWLHAQLALIRGGTDRAKEKEVFDEELLTQVKRFQISEGLVPDGIVGFKTLIHINSATEQAVPTLSVTQEDF
jgi:general secretion pathway protein A